MANLTESQRELLDSIVELHRFETSDETPSNLKALVVEMRTALTKVQGELIASAILQPQSQVFGTFVQLFRIAIDYCSMAAVLADSPNMDSKSLATMLYITGNLAGIESFLRALEKQP